MKVEILKCTSCSAYGLKDSCVSCKGKCVSPKPAKYSVEDKWGNYRRIAKEQQEIA
tara:strand:- start:12529 stop:12696 length:168 start_codon:yes stop_codon:yes gene_type:complete